MLGLGPDHVPRNMRSGGLFITWAHIITEAEYSLVPAIIVSLSCILFLILVKELQARFHHKLRGLPLPGKSKNCLFLLRQKFNKSDRVLDTVFSSNVPLEF